MRYDPPAITTEVDDHIAIIRFSRPVQRNPLSRQTLSDLSTTLSQLANRDEINSVIFTGTADVFASGANIKELAQLGPAAALDFAKLGQGIFQTIADSPKLTIAAINGYCMGGALDLALSCDLRIASPSAVLAHPGVRLGIITGWGGTQRLPRLIPKGAALELLLTGKRIAADEALRIGLVHTVAEQPIFTARMIAGNSLQAPQK